MCNRDKQYGCRQCRGCMDQVFVVKQECKKYPANGKDVLWAFIYFENANDTSDRRDMLCGRC